MNYNEIFKSDNNIYFAHGSGTDKKEIIDSIIENGLRCNHGALQFTSIYLGTKQNVFDYGKDILENWSYKNSGIVFVLALPKYFCIADREELNTTKKQYLSFCFMPTQKDIEEKHLLNKLHIYKEFIVGYYNSNTNEFFKNENFFELLPENDQREFLNQTRNNYLKIIEESCEVEKYKELITKYNIDNGFDENIVNQIIESVKFKEQQPSVISIDPDVPEDLKQYIDVRNNIVYIKEEIPQDLERDYELFVEINNLEVNNE